MSFSHEIENLPNGSELCFVNVDSSRIQMQVEFASAGGLYSPEATPETAHAMEHMIFAGSREYPSARDFRDALRGNAAYANAYTFDDRMEYHLITPRNGADKAIDTYLGAIDAPLLAQAQFDTEREVIREELTGYLSNPNWLVWPHVETVLGFNPKPMQYHIDTLNNITPDDLRQHHRNTHAFDTMRTIVTGNLSDHEKARFIERLQGLSLSPVANVLQVVPTPTAGGDIGKVVFDSASNVNYLMGKFGVAGGSETDRIAHNVASKLLYSYPNSTIMDGGREQGMIYGANGGWNAGILNTYDFNMTGKVSVANAPRFMRLVRTALQGALELTDVDTLERAKTYTIASQEMYSQSNHIHSGVAAQLRQYGRVRTDEETQAIIESLDIPTFQATMRRGFVGGITTGTIVGKAEMLENDAVVGEFQETLNYLGKL